MASEGNFAPAGTKAMKGDLPPTEMAMLSAPGELGQLAGTTSPGPPGQRERAPCNAAIAARKEERDVQHGNESRGVPPVSNERAGETNEFSALYFPQKLWKLVESDRFRSIWWSESRKCVAINEELFKEEVLGRAGPLRVFGMHSMKSFLRQMNLYGFTKMQGDFQRSASLPEFLAEEAAASAHSQILYYCNPNFNKEHPHLLERCKRRVGVKRRALDALQVDEGHPSRSPSAQPAGDTQAPNKRWAEAPPGLGSAPPSPPPAAPSLPEPPGEAGSENFIPLALFFLPTPSSQAPEDLQRAAPAPPQFAIPVLAAPSALLGTRPPHCPTCTCSPKPADGPQRTTC